MTAKLRPGTVAPAFTLAADGGATISLAALRGRKVALFFYPKADTAGCTREAIDFSRLRPRFEKAGTTVVGVSADPVAAQDRFKAKHGLKVQLASDPMHGMLKAFGVWAQKSMYGRKYMGIVRTTFLIDSDGRIAKVWPNVRVDGHADDVLAAAEAL